LEAMGNMQILDPVEIPGWGQIHGHVIEDGITEAERLLAVSGPFKAAELIPQLLFIVQQKTWRSEMAAELILIITRRMLVSPISVLTPPPTQEINHGRVDKELSL